MSDKEYIKSINPFLSKVVDVTPKGVVTIYVNGFNNIDAAKEVSMQGSFTKTIKENFGRIKHLKNHDRTQFLGLPVSMIEDKYGLLVESAMNMDKQSVKDVYSDYSFANKHDRTMEHSIGYIPVKQTYDKKSGVTYNHEYKLLEYSTLDFLGCNENTPLVAMKDLQGIEEQITLLEKMIKHSGYSDEKYMEIEKHLTELRQLSNNIAPEESAELITDEIEPQTEKAKTEELRKEKLKQYLLNLNLK